MTNKCSSCSIIITNQPGSVRFKCPGCSKVEVIRCAVCRKTGTKYVCPECSFAGPN